MFIKYLDGHFLNMPAIYLPRKFIERCEEYLKNHPGLADDAADFIARCGRLGLRYLEKVTTEEERKYCVDKPRREADPFIIDGEGNMDNKEYRGEKVAIYIPKKDLEKVEELVVRKLAITTTVVSWYVLCVFMVIAGYWELPPKI
jgi:hypothetical protein